MDIAFEAVGSQGKFQKALSIMVVSAGFPLIITTAAFSLFTKQSDFLCKKKNNSSLSFHSCPSADLCKNDFFEYKKNPETSFNNWAYEFELYCSKFYISSLIGTAYFIGCLVGAVFLSPLPDKYGRKNIFKILLIVIFALQLGIFFASNEWIVVFLNFLLGISFYGYSLSILMISEFIDRESAGIIVSFINAAFHFSGIFVTLLFASVNNWRIIFFISSALASLCVYLSQKYLVESPRWLNSKNKFTETLDALKDIAKINHFEDNFNKFLSSNSGTLISKLLILSDSIN